MLLSELARGGWKARERVDRKNIVAKGKVGVEFMDQHAHVLVQKHRQAPSSEDIGRLLSECRDLLVG